MSKRITALSLIAVAALAALVWQSRTASREAAKGKSLLVVSSDEAGCGMVGVQPLAVGAGLDAIGAAKPGRPQRVVRGGDLSVRAEAQVDRARRRATKESAGGADGEEQSLAAQAGQGSDKTRRAPDRAHEIEHGNAASSVGRVARSEPQAFPHGRQCATGRVALI